MAHLALIRHAEYQQRPSTPSAGQPWGLTGDAETQCQSGAERIRALSLGLEISLHPVIHCSVLLRAWQTAHELAHHLALDGDSIATSEDLIERSVGSLANLSLDEIAMAMDQDPRFEPPPAHWKSDPHYRLPYPGAESLLEAGNRVAAYLEDIASMASADELLLVVGHGAALRHAAAVLEVLELEQARRVSMHYAQPVVITNTDGSWRHVAGDWKPRTSEQPVD